MRRQGRERSASPSQKRFGAGLFGGEGFIMQRLQGDGWAFIHAGGTLEERTLAPGETLRVDTGCIVAFQPTVDYDIQMVGGIKTALFGGEGLFFADAARAGQGLAAVAAASAAWPAASSPPRRRPAAAPRGEGSILGGLGDILSGDRGN